MKFNENWLRSLVDPQVSRAELAHRLTMAGLEVESLVEVGAELPGIVVGEIVECVQHPNADRLRVCRVDAGTETLLQIVCGAPNARVGLRAPVALVGARLPGGLEIKRAQLRGVDSEGMLCSARELGLGEDADGLLQLDASPATGTPIAQALALPDASFELKLTPNRADCFGLRGLASEVASLFDVAVHAVADPVVAVTSAAARAVTLTAPADCPRYLGRVIENVDARAPSPLWLRERLRRSGLRSISAIVDCTNYVMLELGQPLHAFDHDRLQGGIDVRRAREGEVLKLLDGSDATLDPQFLVIADDRGAVALAGIMGGDATRVTDDSRNLFLEAAHFEPSVIVGRARRLGMHTDASHRFERGVDPELPRRAIDRLTELLLSIVGGQAGAVTEACDAAALPASPEVALRHARVEHLLGMRIERARVASMLRALDMDVRDTESGWLVRAPSRRFDIAIEEDLIEEVARIHGYDRVPSHAPRGDLQLAPLGEGRVRESDFRRLLCARGYFEAVNFSFVAPELLASYGLEAGAKALANGLSSELSVMRTSLVPGLVDALRRNLARQRTRVRLFEIGGTYVERDGTLVQSERIAGVAIGTAQAEQWGAPRRALDFFDLKGDVEQVLALSAAADLGWRPVTDVPWLHPGRSAAVTRCGVPIGVVGCLHPELAGRLDLPADTYVFELDLPSLAARNIPRVGELSRFPAIRRDLAVVLDRQVPYERVESVLRAQIGPRLRELVLFDEYRGQGLDATARSLAIGLILQDDSRTLTDADADGDVARSVAALEQDCGARLRA